jgi:hypothetical protein
LNLYWYEWLVAGLLGTLIGVTDIISRYRDEPDNALATLPALFYLLVNALASIILLVIARAFGWSFGITDPNAMGWGQVMITGLGAMALLRTSLWSVKLGEQNIPIGPNRLLDAILATVDRALDRKRAQQRAMAVSKIMKDVDFDKAFQALPAYCFGLLQNLSQDEQDKFAKKIALLAGAPMNTRVKSLLLGLTLMNLVGEKVLETAVKNLGEDVLLDQGSRAVPPAQ